MTLCGVKGVIHSDEPTEIYHPILQLYRPFTVFQIIILIYWFGSI